MEYTPRMDTDADEDFAAMELSRDTLAACVRELYELLGEAIVHYETEQTRLKMIAAYNRYRAALERTVKEEQARRAGRGQTCQRLMKSGQY
jgi:hypothetical protein